MNTIAGSGVVVTVVEGPGVELPSSTGGSCIEGLVRVDILWIP